MDQVQVKILGQVITPMYGTLNTGHILRTSAAFAKHLVDDCQAAEYYTATDAKFASHAATQKPKGSRKSPKTSVASGDATTTEGAKDPGSGVSGEDPEVQTSAQGDGATPE